MRFFTKEILILFLIIILAFMVRLYKLESPVADWHSWRQADTAAVARNFYKDGYNPFVPKYDDMSGVAENPVPNAERYRFVEFPIYNSLVYFTYLINGEVKESLARLVSITFSIGSLLFVYLITKRHFSKFTAMIAAFLFAFLPYNIYYSRVILPEPSLIFWSLGMFYFSDLWISSNRHSKYFIPATLFTALAFLTKPTAVFYFIPVVYLIFKKEGKFWPIHKDYIYFMILGLVPIFIWRLWIQTHPEGIPASNWLFNGNGIRFRPAFFRWILGDRFGREILGITGSFLFFFGALIKPKLGENWLLHILMFSSLLYLVVFATGNVQHDYYQVLIVPALVIFAARGFTILFEGNNYFLPRVITIPIAILFLVLTVYFGWLEVKGLYQINNGIIVDAGKAADRILPKDAVVLAPYNGDTSFLYQTNRVGWAFLLTDIEDMKARFGLTSYVSVNNDDLTNQLKKTYQVIEDNGRFVIIDLTHKKM
jgi:4-amino-4-deoxy-L-arabinose transferase-like glycosyltransferase